MKTKQLVLGIVGATTLFAFGSCKCTKKSTSTTEETQTTMQQNGRKPAPFRLDGTQWKLVRIDAQNRNFKPTKENDKIVLSFSEGHLSTSDGCNGLSAEYSQDKYLLNFGMFMSTKMYCSPEFMKENGYIVPFSSVKDFWVEGDILTLMNDKGETLATYKKL